jgi:hypothetical protein
MPDSGGADKADDSWNKFKRTAKELYDCLEDIASQGDDMMQADIAARAGAQ